MRWHRTGNSVCRFHGPDHALHRLLSLNFHRTKRRSLWLLRKRALKVLIDVQRRAKECVVCQLVVIQVVQKGHAGACVAPVLQIRSSTYPLARALGE